MKKLWRTMLRRVTAGSKLTPLKAPPAGGHEGQMGPRSDYGQEAYFTRAEALARAEELRDQNPRRRIYVVGLAGRWVVNIEPKKPRGVAQRYQ